MIKVDEGETNIKGEESTIMSEYALLTIKLAGEVGKAKVEKIVKFALNEALGEYKKFLKGLGYSDEEVKKELEEQNLKDDEDDEEEED